MSRATGTGVRSPKGKVAPGPSQSDLASYSVVAEGLTKRFGDFTAVDHVSFRIRKGDIFGFLGPNGSGKTTTIRMLLGLLEPSDGKGWVLGYDVYQDSHIIRKQTGYMSQRFTLYNDLTVEENLDFYGHMYGVRGRRLEVRKQSILRMAGLEGREGELTHNLSGGWKQRLALGAAIIHEPRILFLDEPTAGVDPVSRREFWDLLYTLAEGGTTIFVTTHYMDEAEHCHFIAFIHNSHLVAQGTPEEVKQTEMTGQVLEIDCEYPDRAIAALQQMADLNEIGLYGALIHVVAEGIAGRQDTIAQTLRSADAGLRSLGIIEPSLEDVFIATAKRRQSHNMGS